MNLLLDKKFIFKTRFSQLFFVLYHPKLSVYFKILFILFFKEAIVILSFMYCYLWNTPTYLPPACLPASLPASLPTYLPTYLPKENVGNDQKLQLIIMVILVYLWWLDLLKLEEIEQKIELYWKNLQIIINSC